ncbi:MAG: colanic acid biosynthesis glycosyltransferase WcaL [Alphaproteobacteria bacterium]|nr:colanic acid biosynthesis glycosyltransferase WcaL [Alphaproteobacteria bacterium]
MRIAVVVKGYPRLSETFIAQEIRGLERRGLALTIVSLRQPTDGAVHPVHREIQAPVLYLPEYLWRAPRRVLAGWRVARRLPGYRKARVLFLADLRRDPTPNRIRRWGQALVLAAELAEDVGLLYVHYLHTPASVGRYAGALRGLPWGVSAHAKDIWTTPDREIANKMANAAFAVTCSAYGQARLAALADRPDRVALVHHGLDLVRFPRRSARADRRGGSDPAAPVRILSVARLVEKKGTDDLLDALALLPRDLHWRLVQIGGGPLGKALKCQALRLGIADRIEWRGRQPQEGVLAALAATDIFVLASRVARSGDRDGLPNVLMEAQSQRVAVLATDVAAIPELVEDGVTGTLVPPDEPAALAAALSALIADPARRDALADAGEQRVRKDFDAAAGIDRIAALLRTHLPVATAAARAAE